MTNFILILTFPRVVLYKLVIRFTILGLSQLSSTVMFSWFLIMPFLLNLTARSLLMSSGLVCSASSSVVSIE